MKIDDTFKFDRLSLANINEDTDFIPLVSSESDYQLEEGEHPEEIALLPLRNTVIFPGVVAPITAGRDKSIKLINDAQNGTKLIGVIAQKEGKTETPGFEDLHTVGTLAKIIRMFKMPDGNTTVIIQGLNRFTIKEQIQTEPYLKAKIEVIKEQSEVEKTKDFEILIGSVKDLAGQIIQDSPTIPSEAQFALNNIKSNTFMLNFISSNMNVDVNGKQELLEEGDLMKRTNSVLKHLTKELQMLEVKNEIQDKVKSEFDNQQREYFLNQQMKTIQEELGGNSHESDVEEMRTRGKSKKWNEDTAEHFEKELSKLQRLNPQMPDASVQRNYLELMLDLPWNEFSKDKFDLKRASKILDRDHFGLDKIKERIIEHLAVLKLKGDMKSPILCLYGPPGVGKTSLGKSIAESLGREYQRISLGGLRDEAEIRGHRKTYIGAMPGRIIQSLKKAGNSNPVFVLDQTFCPNTPFLDGVEIFSKVSAISYVSGSKFPSGGLCTAGYCVGNEKTISLMCKIDKHLSICDNEATDLQYEILAKQLPSMNQRIIDAYENTQDFVNFITKNLPGAKINFVSKELVHQGFTPSVFSLDLPTKGNTAKEKENYKRALNLKLINLMIKKIPNESKFCVSYGQLKGSYWTIPATSTQGTTKEGDKDYIVRVSLSPKINLTLHKKVFLEFTANI